MLRSITAVSATNSPLMRPQTVGALTGRVSVSTSRDSWVIKLQVEDETPERAERLAAVIMDRFIDQQNRQQMQRAEVALSFLSTNVTTARERLTAARAAESAFREEHSISSTDGENNIFTDTISQLTTSRSGVERQLNRQQTLLNKAANAMMELGQINRDAIVSAARERLLQLRESQVELGQKYLPKHPHAGNRCPANPGRG